MADAKAIVDEAKRQIEIIEKGFPLYVGVDENGDFETNARKNDPQDKGARFLLGVTGKNPLIVFGVNPSTANDVKDDRTIQAVRRIVDSDYFNDCVGSDYFKDVADSDRFTRRVDSWIMLNLYPQRSTNPLGLHTKERLIDEYRKINRDVIAAILEQYRDAPLLAAWGNNVNQRPYLKECRRDILELAGDRQWYRVGWVTKAGNPHHPLFVNCNDVFPIEFDTDGRVKQPWRQRLETR